MNPSPASQQQLQQAPAGADTQVRMSMREAMRMRLLNQVVRRVQLDGARTKKAVLVLDDRSTRVISAAMQLFDLAEEGIALVEPLLKMRQHFPVLDGIYLVEPTEQNVARILLDFADRKRPTYNQAHVFFTRKASDEVVASLRTLSEPAAGKKKKSKSFVPRLANLFEANVDFLAVEEHVFHLDMPRALVELFGPDEAKSQYCRSRIVDGLASLCATLHEYPWIRYVQGNQLGEQLARGLQERQDALFREDSAFWFHGSDDKSGGGMARATVLFLDRRQDLAAPLLHEFTYQALVYDLLESRDKVVQYGETTADRATLHEQDQVWTQLRHLHVSTVIERLIAQIKEFKSTSAGRFQEQGAEMTLEEMGSVVREIPLYKEVMAAHAMHLALCQACMDKVRRRDLFSVAGLEQTVATGAEADGAAANENKILNDLAVLMRRTEVEPNDKLRLACLHAVTLGSVNQDLVNKFLRDAQPPFSPEAQQAFLGLSKLGLGIVMASNNNVVATTASTTGAVAAWMRAASGRFSSGPVETPYRNPDAVARAQVLAKQTTLKLSRFTPLMHMAAETLCANRMDPDAFPFVMQPPPGSGFGGAPYEELAPGSRVVRRVTTTNRSLSVRTHTSVTQVASDGGKSLEQALKPLGSKDRIGLNGARIIIFVSGGVTYSEMRAITDLAATCKREVIVGSTHIIKPEQFVQDLARLGDDEAARAYLEQEAHLADEAVLFYREDPNAGGLLGSAAAAALLAPSEPEQLTEDLRASLKTEQQLAWISKFIGKIPGLRKFQRFLDGEDSDEEEDEQEGDGAGCGACCAGKPRVSVPAAKQQQRQAKAQQQGVDV